MKKHDKTDCDIRGLSAFERNNYYRNKRLSVESFSLEQRYFNEKRWLLNRLITGWGVVCGLDVRLDEDKENYVIVTPGVAIDCCGREIVVPEEQKVHISPEDLEAPRQQRADDGLGNLVVCLEFDERLTEPVRMAPAVCTREEENAFDRIREHFRIRVRNKTEVALEKPDIDCPPPHVRSCPSYRVCPCLVLAEIRLAQAHSGDVESPVEIVVDTRSLRKPVYTNPMLAELIQCLEPAPEICHPNYITTWLTLGPIFDPVHQMGPHFPNDAHPRIKAILKDIENHVKPEAITDNTGELEGAPRHRDLVDYGSTAESPRKVFQKKTYMWRIRSFSGMHWMHIQDIEDNIHKHLPGDYQDDPFDPKNQLNFQGKHHALVFFLVYIRNPDPSPREVTLCIRSDDGLRVWFNGKEILSLQHLEERDIDDYGEYRASFELAKRYNVLMAAVAEAHVEWGFSARFENDQGLRFMTDHPRTLFRGALPCESKYEWITIASEGNGWNPRDPARTLSCQGGRIWSGRVRMMAEEFKFVGQKDSKHSNNDSRVLKWWGDRVHGQPNGYHFPPIVPGIYDVIFDDRFDEKEHHAPKFILVKPFR